VFSRLQFTDGGTLVLDPWAAAGKSPVTMTWSGNGVAANGAGGLGGTSPIQTPGSGYVVGDTITLTNGVSFRVATVGAGGSILTTKGPLTQATSVVANPVPQASTTGSGSGATFNVTYSLANFGVPSATATTGILAGTNKGGFGCLLSTTGTLPTGLTVGTPYFMHFGPAANTINLCTDSKKGAGPASAFNGYIGPSDPGTGTHTLTPVPFLCWGSGLFLVPGTALWNYVQASGSAAADDTCRILVNNTYLRSTRMIPPYDLTLVGGTAKALQTYVMNGVTALVEPDMGNTGERSDIGPLRLEHAFYMVNQDATSEQNMRVFGHVDTHFSSCVRSVSNGCIINGRTDPTHGTYAGINQPPSNDGSQLRWDAGNLVTSAPNPPTANWQGSFTQIADEHHSIFSYPALLIFGEPQFYDMMMERANAMPLARANALSNPALYNAWRGVPSLGSEKNFSVNGTIYEGCVLGGTSSRADAWALRNVAWAAAIASDVSYDGADYKTYFNDCLDNSFNSMLDWRSMYPAGYAVDNGVFGYIQTGRDSEWQSGYRRMAACIAIGAAESTPAVSFMNLVVKRPIKMCKIARDAGSAAPLFNITGYHSIVTLHTSGGDAMPSDFINSDSHMGNTVQTTLSASAGNQNISYSVVPASVGTTHVPNVGDWFIFDGATGTGRSAPFNIDTPYFVVAVDAVAKTVQLSATPGGAPITPTTAMTGIETEGVSLFDTAHSTATSLGADSYMTVVGAWTNWGLALADQGVVIDATFAADVADQLAYQKANFAGYASGIKTNPKYTMSPSF